VTRPVISHDPAVRFGNAQLKGISTEAIADLYWAENGDEVAVCANYGLDRYELATALWYEATHGDARRLFAGWARWADEVAYPRLSGFAEPLDIDTLPLPPGRDEVGGNGEGQPVTAADQNAESPSEVS
jgi:uncharacterized protein (DUF433 family)